MTPRLPVLSGADCVRALQSNGFVIRRQKGSHVVLRRARPPHWVVVVPDHAEIRPGTLQAILKQARLSRQRFLESL